MSTFQTDIPAKRSSSRRSRSTRAPQKCKLQRRQRQKRRLQKTQENTIPRRSPAMVLDKRATSTGGFDAHPELTRARIRRLTPDGRCTEKRERKAKKEGKQTRTNKRKGERGCRHKQRRSGPKGWCQRDKSVTTKGKRGELT